MTDALLEALSDALGLAQGAPAAGWASATDAQLARLIAVAAGLRQTVERHAALGAGEVARRSTPDRGLSGFVQQAGHRTVEEFLKAGSLTRFPGRVGCVDHAADAAGM